MEKPILFSTPMVQAILDGRKTMTRRVVKPQPASGVRLSNLVPSGLEDGHGCELKAKYQPGDILWVRETWNCIRFGNGRSVPHETEYWYKADEKSANPDNKWRPSIFLPKSAARIWLRVTDVRVERLQDIRKANPGPGNPIVKEGFYYSCDFVATWDELNAKHGYGWDANPWVWVISFERIEKPQ